MSPSLALQRAQLAQSAPNAAEQATRPELPELATYLQASAPYPTRLAAKSDSAPA